MHRSHPLILVLAAVLGRIPTTRAFTVVQQRQQPQGKPVLLARHDHHHQHRYGDGLRVSRRRAHSSLFAKKKKKSSDEDDTDDDDKDQPPLAGMEEAFRQLESLDSLEDGPSSSSSSSAPSSRSSEKSSSSSDGSSSSSLPLEKEVEVYKNLVGELESKEDVYGNVLSDMKDGNNPNAAASSFSSSSDSPLSDPAMQQALAEALQEVSKKDAAATAASPSSILNDKEIMKEIEAIMERGNDELMESLEKIRREQTAYAASQAADSAQQAVDNYEASQEARLAAAENAVQIWLQRVRTEQAAVQQAVDDLAAAQKEMEGSGGSLVSKLRKGGIPKQMALVGLLLFSLRSIVDTVASFNDPTMLTGALVQAGIALACAAFLFLF